VVQVARELVAQRQKDRALLALKRRKLHEQQLEKLVSKETLQLRRLAEACCACFAYILNTTCTLRRAPLKAVAQCPVRRALGSSMWSRC
jgi:hypothetical protein